MHYKKDACIDHGILNEVSQEIVNFILASVLAVLICVDRCIMAFYYIARRKAMRKKDAKLIALAHHLISRIVLTVLSLLRAGSCMPLS